MKLFRFVFFFFFFAPLPANRQRVVVDLNFNIVRTDSRLSSSLEEES